MKQVLHKEKSNAFRVIQRGSGFYFQRNTGPKGTRENDPWIDDAPAKDNAEAAIQMMYARQPLTQQP